MTPDEIKQLLPGVFHLAATQGSPLMALLQVMSAMHQPTEDGLRILGQYFSPYQTPDDFLPYLGSWLLLDQYYTHAADGTKTHYVPGAERLRELIAGFAQIAQWRGTPKGLINMLELATGYQGFQINEQVPNGQGVRRQFHMQIIAPSSTQTFKKLIERIVTHEKPAYVTFDIQFDL